MAASYFTRATRRKGVHSFATDAFAVILAGGRGERLKFLTEQQAKPALPFGAKYRVIDFALSNCINSGVRRIGVATQYCAHDLLDHIQHGWNFLNANMGEFVELWPAQQRGGDCSWYAGTADAVYRNIERLRGRHPRHVLILAGDHVYKQDYAVMIAEHEARGAEVTVSCVEVPREEARRFGVVETGDDDQIVKFWEKPVSPPALRDTPGRSFASMGVYVFNTDVLHAVLKSDARKAGSAHDFGRDILPSLVGRCRLFAHRFSRSCVSEREAEPYWRDVGTLDAYWEANMEMVRATPALDLYDRDWPLRTAHVERPPVRLLQESGERPNTISNAVISEGCLIAGAIVRNAQIFHDVTLNAFSMVEDSVVMQECEVGARARIRKTILAPGCKIPDGLVVGEDAVSDARYFHRTAAGVTVVTPRMLEKLKAIEEQELVVAMQTPPRSVIHAGLQVSL